MPILYILCGLPFSGKSLLSKEIEKRTSIKRVSFDDLWTIISKSNKISPYKITLQEVEKILIENLSNKISIVYDSPSLKLEQRSKLKSLAEKFGAQFKVIYLPVSIDEVHKRRALSLKDKTHHIVKDTDFDRALKQLEPPTDSIIISNDQEKEDFIKNL